MSDRQKGLIDAIEELLPGCEHRFCVMHLYKNFKMQYRGLALKNIVWKAARASRVTDFDRAMAELKNRDVAAFEWLMQKPPSHWSRSYFGTHCKSDILVNNMSESFNSKIMRARNKPIVTMLETIRLMLMKRIHERRDQMKKYNGELTPWAAKLLEELKKKSMEFIAHWNGKDQFEIESAFGSKFQLNLGDKTCSCRRWDLIGMPCAHAISGLYYIGYTPEDYVDNYYRKETFMKSYSHLMGALNGMDMWPETSLTPLIPPVFGNMPGRPKKYSRKPTDDEGKRAGKQKDKQGSTKKLSKRGVTMTCSKCHKANHNARACPLNKQNEPANEGLDIPAPINERQATKGRKRKGLRNQDSRLNDNTVDEGLAVPIRTEERQTRKGRKRKGSKDQDSRLNDNTLDEGHSGVVLTAEQYTVSENHVIRQVIPPTPARKKGKEKVSHIPTRSKGKEKVLNPTPMRMITRSVTTTPARMSATTTPTRNIRSCGDATNEIGKGTQESTTVRKTLGVKKKLKVSKAPRQCGKSQPQGTYRKPQPHSKVVASTSGSCALSRPIERQGVVALQKM